MSQRLNAVAVAQCRGSDRKVLSPLVQQEAQRYDDAGAAAAQEEKGEFGGSDEPLGSEGRLKLAALPLVDAALVVLLNVGKRFLLGVRKSDEEW